MGFWAAAAPIAGAVLGGIGGKNKSKQQNAPQRRVVLPPQQLGGWGRIQEILQGLKSAPMYRVGQGNPYLQQGMEHIFNRAGMQAPPGGYGPNPYLQPPPQQPPMPQQQPQIPPEMLAQIQGKMPGGGGY